MLFAFDDIHLQIFSTTTDKRYREIRRKFNYNYNYIIYDYYCYCYDYYYYYCCCCNASVCSTSARFLVKIQTFIGSGFPFIGTRPLYVNSNCGSQLLL